MDIDKLQAGPALDKLIAEKVMGWKWDETKCRECGFPLDPQGKFCRPDDCSERPRRAVRADAIPLYSTDIAAAWEVAQRLFLGHQNLILWRSELFWEVAPLDVDGIGMPLGEGTAPLAICQAALKMIEGRPDAHKG